MNTLDLQVRPAVQEDVPLVVDLIRLTMGDEVDWLFGQTVMPADEVVARLVNRTGNRFSLEYCSIAVQAGEAAGLLLAFAGRNIYRLEARMGLHLVRIIGLEASLRLAKRQKEYGRLVEAEKDEFYVAHVGVLPEFQGQGVGSALLDLADGLARQTGLEKCSLLVTRNNPACRLYERHGYKIVAEFPLEHPVLSHGAGFYRMVKLLPPHTGTIEA
jgi:ribosomal protein S18 acetylase RimI-like enzyme